MIGASVAAPEPEAASARPLERVASPFRSTPTLATERSLVADRPFPVDRSFLFDVGLGLTTIVVALALNLFR